VPSSQWVEQIPGSGPAITPAHTVVVASGVAAIDDTGPSDAVWIATETAGVVALSDTGTSAARLIRMGDGPATLYG
jgi:hypothetical protein